MSIFFQSTAPSKRNETIDFIRGVANFGILMVNMHIFYNPVSRMVIGYLPAPDIASSVAESFMRFFFEGKFYVLFSWLFGYGFWIFINKSNGETGIMTIRYIIRLIILLCFGIIHIVLLWAGDILVFYALLGFLLLAFRSKSDKSWVRWAVASALVPSFLYLLFGMFYLMASMHPEAKAAADAGMKQTFIATQELYQQALEVYKSGSWHDAFQMRLTEYNRLLPGLLFFYPVVFAMFLLGAWSASKRMLEDFPTHWSWIKKWMIISTLIGIAANALYVISYRKASIASLDIWGFLSNFMHTLGGISFGFSYMAILAKVATHAWFGKPKVAIASVGRMALTNYLLHSIVCTLLFMPWGLGLAPEMNAWKAMLIAILIYLLQIMFSAWWLNQFYFGPFEWLWRSLTYGRLQPFIRKSNII